MTAIEARGATDRNTSRHTNTAWRLAERLWKLADAPLADRLIADLDDLEALAAARCRQLHAHPEWLRGRTAYAWWPDPTTQQRPVA